MRAGPAGGHTFAALRNRNFRLYWIGQLVSLTGTWMQTLALAWQVLTLTNSPLALGTVTTLQFLPMLLLSLHGGVLADRVPKRRFLLATQTAAACQALALGLLTATGAVRLWEIYALAVVLGLANALDNPTRRSFVIELVGREGLANALALSEALFQSSRVVGPALGGLAVAALGFSWCYYLNAASFLGLITGLLLMDPTRFHHLPPPLRGPIWRGIRESLSYVVRTPEVCLVIILLSALGTFGYTSTVFLPLLARYVLAAGPTTLGTLTASLGVGAVATSLWMARSRLVTRRLLLASSAGYSLLLLPLGLSHRMGVTIGLLLLLGAAGVVFHVTASTRVQLLVPDDLRGRLMGLYTLLFLGTTPIGSLFVGATAQRWGVPTMFALDAGLCACGFVLGLAYALWRRLAAEPAAVAARGSP